MTSTKANDMGLTKEQAMAELNLIEKEFNPEIAQEIGDLIIGTIELKKVENPLDNDSVFKKSMEKGLEDHPVQEKYLKKATEIIEQLYSDE